MAKTCETCRWCFLEDYGYSNYTTEGTQVYCLIGRHPSGNEGFDRFYGENKDQLGYAEDCLRYTVGEPIEVDVDKERSDYNSSEPWYYSYTQDVEVRSLMTLHEEGYSIREQERLI